MKNNKKMIKAIKKYLYNSGYATVTKNNILIDYVGIQSAVITHYIEKYFNITRYSVYGSLCEYIYK